MVPKPRHRLLGNSGVPEAAAVIIKDGKFFPTHDVAGRLRLDASPDFANGPFEHGTDARMDLTVFVVLDNLECAGDSELVRCCAAHSGGRERGAA